MKRMVALMYATTTWEATPALVTLGTHLIPAPILAMVSFHAGLFFIIN